jgi:hypothetical protein
MVPRKKITDTTFESLIENKSVAVIGNASSLFEKEYGEEIDAHDIVIRFNKAANFYCNYDVSKTHGQKTHIWAFWSIGGFIKNVINNQNETNAKLQKYFYNKNEIYKLQARINGYSKQSEDFCNFVAPSNTMNNLSRKVVLCSKYLDIEKRKYQSYVLRNANYSLNKLEPSIGLIVLEWLSVSRPEKVSVYGMDFKNTPTFSEPGKFETDMKGKVDIRCNHNFALEEVYAKRHIFTKDNYVLRG